jgi:dolichyl-phosphate beta-glucosyltransferase
MSEDNGGPFLSVVIPAYNEEHRLLPTLQKVTSYLANQPYESEVIVVDDGSSDGTVGLVR